MQHLWKMEVNTPLLHRCVIRILKRAEVHPAPMWNTPAAAHLHCLCLNFDSDFFPHLLFDPFFFLRTSGPTSLAKYQRKLIISIMFPNALFCFVYPTQQLTQAVWNWEGGISPFESTRLHMHRHWLHKHWRCQRSICSSGGLIFTRLQDEFHERFLTAGLWNVFTCFLLHQCY